MIRDILHRLADRFPRHVIVWPVQVLGKEAAGQVTRAIEGFNTLEAGGAIPKPDLLIVARGGGSLEDLWAFNEEVVVRAAAASVIPLISAVGHETDTTLIDFASDFRAPTPSAAAETAVPVRSELLLKTASLAQRLEAGRRRFLQALGDKITGLARGIPSPKDILGLAGQRLDDLNLRLPRSLGSFVQGETLKLERATSGLSSSTIRQIYSVKETRFLGLGRVFESLSYQSILKRGYTVVRDAAGKAVTVAKNIAPGAALDIEFRDGHVPVVVSGDRPPAKKKASGHKIDKSLKKDQGNLF